MSRTSNTIGVLVIAVSLMTGVGRAAAGPDTPAAATHESAATGHYLAIQTALAADTITGVSEHAEALGADLGSGQAEADRSPSPLEAAAENLARATTVEEARKAFGALNTLLLETDAWPDEHGLNVAYCPMADEHWLQSDGPIANPYYGSRMLRCGQFVKPLADSH